MRLRRALIVAFLSVIAGELHAQDFLDRLDRALTISAFDDRIRARLSGTLDLEGYFLQQPPPGLLFTTSEALFNPRLTLYLDVQIGSSLYLFGQARVDRGFDPSDQGARMRLDEYALRLTPWEDGRFNLQVGQFATVVGNRSARHASWENPFITAPLPYENLSGIWDSVAAPSVMTLQHWAHVSPFLANEYADKHLRQPIIWGPDYTSGVSVFGRLGKFDYAAELKNTSLSSRPEYWSAAEVQWEHPTVSGRVGFRPNQMWNFGFSASVGSYLQELATKTLAPGHGLGDYREIVLGQDIAFAWHHWQIWAEFYEARFEIPTVGNADTLAYYIEGKYKFTPQLFGALRWNQQLFSQIDGDRWSRNIWRIDSALGYRFTSRTQFKVQYSLQHESDGPRDAQHTAAVQFTVRF